MCRAQQHTTIVAAHDEPCAVIVRQPAFKMPQIFWHAVLLVAFFGLFD